jgi:hypothetical protein
MSFTVNCISHTETSVENEGDGYIASGSIIFLCVPSGLMARFDTAFFTVSIYAKLSSQLSGGQRAPDEG